MQFVIKWSEYVVFEVLIQAKNKEEAREMWEQGDPRVWSGAEISNGALVDDSLQIIGGDDHVE